MKAQEYYAKFRPHLEHDLEIDGKPAPWLPDHPKQWGSEATRIDFEPESPDIPGFGINRHLSTSDDDRLLSVTVGSDIHIYNIDYASTPTGDNAPHIQLKQVLRSGHGGGKVGFAEFQPNGNGTCRILVSSGAYLDNRRNINTVRVWDLDAEEMEAERLIPLAADAASRAASSVLQHKAKWPQDALGDQDIARSFEKVLRVAQTRIDIEQARVLQGYVKRRAFSRDGASLLVFEAGPEYCISVIAVDSLRARFQLRGHSDIIMWAEYSPDNKLIGTSSWDKTVRVWDAANGELVHIMAGATNQSWNAAFSPNSKIIAAGAGDQKVRLWNVETGELIHTFGGYKNWVRSLSFSLDGKTLAAGAGDASLRTFSVMNGGDSGQHWQMGAGEGNHADPILWTEFSPNNRVIGTSCWDKPVRIWNAVNGELIHMLTGATNQSWKAAFSPDSSMMATGASDQKVRLWNVESGELVHTFEGYKNWVRSLSFSPDGQTLAAGAGDASLRIFSVLSGGDSLQQWQMGTAEGSMIDHFIGVRNVMYTAKGLLIFKTTDGRVYTFDAGTGRKGQFEHREDVVGSIGSGNCITSHDGNWIFIANFDGVVRVWRI
ncbi:hypothetical protein GYMLUDRAFT_223263 [Collybiopsis luxurians FD-317 M1]|uniref:WD40 repeat-like protein n=1 Tax=Collybiopsis luxurians FD-317 M1 TaxID=944289 RepID=A0A0D0CIZ3_9AGAR|nr:hypothetical protein GYMLUDRAFT_223263 [Collybiopsis luxurians FD-317 M1]